MSRGEIELKNASVELGEVVDEAVERVRPPYSAGDTVDLPSQEAVLRDA